MPLYANISLLNLRILRLNLLKTLRGFSKIYFPFKKAVFSETRCLTDHPQISPRIFHLVFLRGNSEKHLRAFVNAAILL
jgi:hypothetical protein